MALGLILLAAGASSRMGCPKQLLKLGTTTLLGNAIHAASESTCDPIIVVLGAHADQILAHLTDAEKIDHVEVVRTETNSTVKADSRARLSFIINKNWEEGLASSLKAGLERLVQSQPDTDGVIVCTCDQPLLNAHLLDLLSEKLKDRNCKIAASAYCSIVGTPAAFSNSLFSELLSLTGDTGAKSLFKRHSSALSTIDFPGGEQDIDTIDDYEQLKASYAK